MIRRLEAPEEFSQNQSDHWKQAPHKRLWLLYIGVPPGKICSDRYRQKPQLPPEQNIRRSSRDYPKKDKKSPPGQSLLLPFPVPRPLSAALDIDSSFSAP